MSDLARTDPARPRMVAERLVWDEATTQRLWDYYAQFPQLYFTTAYGPAIVRQLARLVQHQGQALDYGCGTGGLIKPLLDLRLRVAAIEASAAARVDVTERFKDDPAFLGAWDPAEIDSTVLAGRCNVIYFIEVIEHLDDRALATTFAALRRLLAPGGWLICSTPNDEDLEAAMVFCPASGKVFHPMQHVRSWTADSLSARLSAEGFAQVTAWTTDFGADGRYFRRQWAVRNAKRLLRFPYKDPHLVAIGRRGATV